MKAAVPPGSPLRRLDSLETLRAMVDRLREGIYVTTRDGSILDANPAFFEMFGVASLEELGRYSVDDLLVFPGQREREVEILAREGSVREYELQIRRPDGDERTVLDTAYAVTDPVSGEVLYHGILVDITDLKKLQARLHEQAIHDPLTGCFNRHHLAALAERVDATEASWGVIVVDLDHFKRYNDQFGHLSGDDVLVKTARFLMNQVRTEDVVVRLGGDEFLLYLVGAGDETVATVARRLRGSGERKAPVPFTFGQAVRLPGEDLEATIARADDELLRVRAEARRFDAVRVKLP